MPPLNREQKLQAIAVAKLRSQGRGQVEIAKILRISQGDVSRRLRNARELEILTPNPTFHTNKVFASDLEAVNCRYFLDAELTNKVKGWAPKNIHCTAHVFGPTEDAFSTSAAERVLESLKGSNCVGVLWGRSILALIQAMQSSSQSRDFHRHIECIPLCGDPLFVMFQDNQDFSASQLAALLEKTLTGNLRILPTLTGVPAYFSQSPAHQRKIREEVILKGYIHKIPGYQRIFLTSDALVRKVDTLLTGVGIFKGKSEQENATGAFLRERLAQESISSRQLSKLVIGDIGGILVPRDGLTSREYSRVRELNSGWLGISEGQIVRIAQEAKKGGHPGVIVVARGARKAEVVRHVVQKGYVNELIIDGLLAEKLKTEP